MRIALGVAVLVEGDLGVGHYLLLEHLLGQLDLGEARTFRLRHRSFGAIVLGINFTLKEYYNIKEMLWM